MGFKIKHKVYKLDFTGTEYDGLEVRVGGLTMGEWMEFVGLADSDEPSNDTDRMLKMFAAHLKSWNLEDEDDEPVPATLDALRSVDFKMVMFIIHAWMDALADVPKGTGKGSASGETSLEASIPMTELS
jgi:hypothetical protein